MTSVTDEAVFNHARYLTRDARVIRLRSGEEGGGFNIFLDELREFGATDEQIERLAQRTDARLDYYDEEEPDENPFGGIERTQTVRYTLLAVPAGAL